MSTYTQYTKTAKKDLFLVFRCAHCGFKTAFKQPFQQTATYDDKWSGKVTLAEKEKNATQDLVDWQRTLLRNTRRAVHELGFLDTKTPVFCPRCEKTPTWVYTPSPLVGHLTVVSHFLMVLALIGLVRCTITDSGVPGLLVAAGLLAAGCLMLLPKRIESDKHKKAAQKADSFSLPIVCGTAEEAQEVLAAMDDGDALNELLEAQQNPYSRAPRGTLTLVFDESIKKATVYFAGKEIKVKNTQEQELPVIADSYLIVNANNISDSPQLLIRAKKHTVVKVSCTKTDTELELVSQQSARSAQ